MDAACTNPPSTKAFASLASSVSAHRIPAATTERPSTTTPVHAPTTRVRSCSRSMGSSLRPLLKRKRMGPLINISPP